MMYVKEKTAFSQLGEFGIIIQAVVATVQAAALGAAAAIEYDSVKKYLKTEGRTIQASGAAALKLKQQELASRESLLRIKGQTALLSDTKLKKLVIIGGVTVSAITLLGIVIYYMLTVGGEDE